MKNQNIVYKFLVLYLILTLITFFNPVAAQTTISLQQADSLFAEQKFTEAYKLYEQILAEGKASPAMLLRMAYVDESLQRVPQALYHLNLYYQQTADREVLNKIEELAASEKLRGYEYSDEEYLRNLLYQNRQSIALGLMVISGLVFLALVYVKFRLRQRPMGLGFLLLVALGGLAYFVSIPLTKKQAIVMEDFVPLMSGPSAGSSLVQMIGRGHRLEVLNKQDVWYKVQWGEQVLFVKETAVERI
ncbi:SH3 domain-containing protein [Nafulsella turpanensis]|uniref:SH3 domain-containing protein n=1 Tax=Nafulsella turpanensis TaxID=1265690 RepID=UPI0003460B77|nr:SH3 domain-containing protein [Nafulsella turpanensis]